MIFLWILSNSRTHALTEKELQQSNLIYVPKKLFVQTCMLHEGDSYNLNLYMQNQKNERGHLKPVYLKSWTLPM